MVGKTELMSRLTHNGRNFIEVRMTDMGENMVLDLEIQATEQESDEPALDGKVRRCSQLMFKKTIVDLPFFVRKGEGDVLDDVGKLEDDRHREAGSSHETQVPEENSPGRIGKDERRDHQEQGDMD